MEDGDVEDERKANTEWIGDGGGALGCLALQGCESDSIAAPAQDEESAKIAVRTVAVGREDVVEQVRYVAEVKASATAKVYAPMTEIVTEFPWENGDFIKSGELVAELRGSSIISSRRQADAQIDALDAQIKNQREELERAKALRDARVSNQQAVDQLEAALEASLANRKGLKASRSQIKQTLSDATIEAPISGVIAQKSVEQGDYASPQAPLCVIMQMDTLDVEIGLTERDAARVFIGQKVALSFDAYPGESFHGEVSRIMPYLDPLSRTNTAVVSLTNERDEARGTYKLKPGMFARAELVLSEQPDALVAESDALLLPRAEDAPANLRFAYVVNDGVAHKRELQVGARQGEKVVVLAGLEEGDRLVVRGQHKLSEGSQVSEEQPIAEAN